MPKLELKHIAPYLPYGLKKHCPTSNVLIHEYIPMDFIQTTIDLHLSFGWKPILRPMSDFDRMGLVGDEYWSYMSKLNSEMPDDLQVDRDLEFDIDRECYVHCKYAMQVYDFLYENHFDVFGLIDQGLAIDINRL